MASERTANPAYGLWPYEVIARDFEASIRSGQYEIGDWMPPFSVPAKQYEVSRTVVQHAYIKLVAGGFLSYEANKGYRVAAVPVQNVTPRMEINLHTRLVPDEWWVVIMPLIPAARTRPQGGGRTRVDDRAVFTAMVYVLTARIAWRKVPASFGVTVPTVYRRFVEWWAVDLWRRGHEALVETTHDVGLLDWSLAVSRAAKDRASYA